MNQNRLQVIGATKEYIDLSWTKVCDSSMCRVLYTDTHREGATYVELMKTTESTCRVYKSTHRPYYIQVIEEANGVEVNRSSVIKTPVKKVLQPQREKLNRGLIGIKTSNGVFLSWRLYIDEVWDYSPTGMVGYDFHILKNGETIASVTESTNYLDLAGTVTDVYQVVAYKEGEEKGPSTAITVVDQEEGYLEIPLKIPEGGVTPSGEAYSYHANDMSVADVDGDGDYEFILKWDPTNSHDVSHSGYTGPCYIDCYKLDGRLLWRLDMGPNIRSGAHYTQFMVYDFDGDGRGEMSVKTAPGTRMYRYDDDGVLLSADYISMPEDDCHQGYSHEDNYVCSAKDYRQHLVEVFGQWHEHPEVVAGNWPQTLEEAFGMEKKYVYPLVKADAEALVDYFIRVYAPARSPNNTLENFEGFIYEGPEYLTMFAGDGKEIETIPFRFPRGDDGLMWGDYAMKRIEPCNRVDRFLSGVGYLDGEHPYLIVARGYYTRTTLVAYRFINGHHEEVFAIDSGHVPMTNPFKDNPHALEGTDPVYGCIAGQGNHSLATADVDGDGKDEIIYGACTIDHDGSILYSSYDKMPDGSIAKLGHGDAMHVANINPFKPGMEIFNVFEGGVEAPYGYALRDAGSGAVIFGEYATVDLGRCMIGDIRPDVDGLQVWVKEVYDCEGNRLSDNVPGTNQSIRWSGDLSTQIIDGANYLDEEHGGVINDHQRGALLKPVGVATNNGTKGNPCLVADIFGDYREELIVRTEDDSALRIYINTELTHHKLFTLMHDIQYRTGVAWQNNCYNQPGYTSFYYGRDMLFSEVVPAIHGAIEARVFLVGDSTVRIDGDNKEMMGWGQQIASFYDRAIRFYNHAKAGRGTKNYRQEGRFQEVIHRLNPGDFVLIQFGHNDAKADDPNRFVEAYGAYTENLRTMIQECRRKGAMPILVTPVAVGHYDSEGRVIDFHGDYSKAMRRLAHEEKAPLIDLERRSIDLLEELGEAKGRALYGDEACVHFNEKGAYRMAKLVAEEMKTIGLPLLMKEE